MKSINKMEDFFQKITEFLQKNKNTHLRLPNYIDTILQERQSNWSFILEIENTCDTEKEIAIFKGNIDTSRYVSVDAAGQYEAIGGGMVQTPYPDGTIINLKDDPRLLNKITGHIVDCVASQEHSNTGAELSIPKQTVFKDATGEVTVSSKDFYLNFLTEFIKNAASRIFELQISSSNNEIFSSRLFLKQLNPYFREEPRYINLEDYYLPDNSESVKIIVPTPFNITHETLQTLLIPAATRVSIGMRFSAYMSEANAINNELKPGIFLQKLDLLTQNVTGTNSLSGSNESNVSLDLKPY